MLGSKAFNMKHIDLSPAQTENPPIRKTDLTLTGLLMEGPIRFAQTWGSLPSRAWRGSNSEDSEDLRANCQFWQLMLRDTAYSVRPLARMRPDKRSRYGGWTKKMRIHT
jgi:uncharacterized protein YceH (UPF0502 family)